MIGKLIPDRTSFQATEQDDLRVATHGRTADRRPNLPMTGWIPEGVDHGITLMTGRS